MMLTHAASLLDTMPPAISLALSLLGAVTKAIENSSAVRPDAMLATGERRGIAMFRKDLRRFGIHTTAMTVI